jgi:hypothetical protein
MEEALFIDPQQWKHLNEEKEDKFMYYLSYPNVRYYILTDVQHEDFVMKQQKW